MRKLVVILLLWIGTLTLSAQTITPFAGNSVSNITADGKTNGWRIGFTAGVAVNLPIASSAFSFQPEIKYIQKGTRSHFNLHLTGSDASYYSGHMRIRSNYLELPLLVKYTFGENTKYFISAGPSLSVGLGGRVKFGDYNGKVKYGEPERADQIDVYFANRFDFGVQAGAGVIFADKVLLDLRYGTGLTSLQKGVKTFNNSFQLTVGMPLNLFK